MNNEDSIQYLIDRPEPSELFLAARQIAGMQLQEQFGRFNLSAPPSHLPAFRWIKAELTYPSFDHLSFAHKNSIFSVVIDIRQGQESSLSEQQMGNLMDVCQTHQLVPCVFTIDFDDELLLPRSTGWNLVHADTLQSIDPLSLAEDGPVVMSAWELANFSIQVVRDYLEKQGNEVLSFCDLPEVNPQIWFRDSEGKECWLIVKNTVSNEPLDSSEWQGFEKSNDSLKPHDGYFAAVRIKSTQDVLLRGAGMMVDFRGIEKIYAGEE